LIFHLREQRTEGTTEDGVRGLKIQELAERLEDEAAEVEPWMRQNKRGQRSPNSRGRMDNGQWTMDNYIPGIGVWEDAIAIQQQVEVDGARAEAE